jgi:hypothetical protein
MSPLLSIFSLLSQVPMHRPKAARAEHPSLDFLESGDINNQVIGKNSVHLNPLGSLR